MNAGCGAHYAKILMALPVPHSVNPPISAAGNEEIHWIGAKKQVQPGD